MSHGRHWQGPMPSGTCHMGESMKIGRGNFLAAGIKHSHVPRLRYASNCNGAAGDEPLSSLDSLARALRCLPGVGPKAAQRMALHLMQHRRHRLRLANTAFRRVSGAHRGHRTGVGLRPRPASGALVLCRQRRSCFEANIRAGRNGAHAAGRRRATHLDDPYAADRAVRERNAAASSTAGCASTSRGTARHPSGCSARRCNRRARCIETRTSRRIPRACPRGRWGPMRVRHRAPHQP